MSRDTGGEYRIFTITAGHTVGISGLTITRGFALGADGSDGSDGGGGGILSAGTLTITNCLLEDNDVKGGNGISGNGGNGLGGGIASEGTLTIIGSSFNINSATGGSGSDNGSRGEGGAIYSIGPM